jgi:hypothetical protein
MGKKADKIRGISKGTEREWMRGAGKEIKEDAQNLREEIRELRTHFFNEIDKMKGEIREIKKERIALQKQKYASKTTPRSPKPRSPPSLEDMRSEWAVLVATIDKMSRKELFDARDRIQWLGKKLDAALGENYLSITTDTIKKIDKKLR